MRARWLLALAAAAALTVAGCDRDDDRWPDRPGPAPEREVPREPERRPLEGSPSD